MNDTSQYQGMLYLVGAGPGDPNLLTVKASKLLEIADIVAHDALISQEILERIQKNKRLLVGHRSTQKRPPLIDHRIVEAVKKGLCVVRLKSGDPFMFGRIGEEITEIKKQGLPFEIVPGISSFMGAASSLKMPLTHRDIAHELHCLSGHQAEGKHCGFGITTVGFMISRRLKENVNLLITRGYSPDTPAVLIACATRPEEKILGAPLSHIVDKAEEEDFFAHPDDGHFPPSLLIVGEIVRSSDRLRLMPSKNVMSENKQPERTSAGLMLVYTGDGKGKTTAALGIAMRHLGYRKTIGMVQFIKGKRQTGEALFISQTPLFHHVISGRGFTWKSNDISQDRDAARHGWEQAQNMIMSGRYEAIILDEITYPINYDFLSLNDVLETLRKRPRNLHVILTGRKAHPELIKEANLVTTMEATKHPYQQGIKAIKALDY